MASHDRYVGQVNDPVGRILAVAEANEGQYDGSLEELLPWSFWVQELTDPVSDVERMLRVWHGDYIECYHFGQGAAERYGYLFRNGLGFGYLSVSENMAFQYFRYFFTDEQARTQITRGRSPSKTTLGLPSPEAIAAAEISADELPEFLAFARSVAIGYVAGDDYSEQVRDLVLKFQDLIATQDP